MSAFECSSLPHIHQRELTTDSIGQNSRNRLLQSNPISPFSVTKNINISRWIGREFLNKYLGFLLLYFILFPLIHQLQSAQPIESKDRFSMRDRGPTGSFIGMDLVFLLEGLSDMGLGLLDDLVD